MFGFEFADAGYFWILLVIVPMVTWYVFKERGSHADLRFSSLQLFRQVKGGAPAWTRHALFALRLAGLFFLTVALARPQSSNSWQEHESEGIDIMLALDISTSMLARDFTPDRLEAAKEVATKFILERPRDRIGLVVFSGESFTQSPLTTDRAVLINVMKEIKSGMIEDGTAIGLGLSNAINRLKDSPSKSRVIILLTDGVNNRTTIAPITAAELAKTFGIRVYTIGVGTMGEAPYPVPTDFGIVIQPVAVEIDEEILTRIADMTGGKYFRATDNQKLEQIYGEIDQLEKSRIEVKHFSKKNEKYLPFALAGLLLLLGEALVRYTLFRKIP
ncbi:MAG: VWA domain-containing protein [Odoribacteraceae bacterium]|jgi:Ca-activated chloride channel family protein|nr:VWA domain-containing protein [Odoribacteraceae bacterium]